MQYWFFLYGTLQNWSWKSLENLKELQSDSVGSSHLPLHCIELSAGKVLWSHRVMVSYVMLCNVTTVSIPVTQQWHSLMAFICLCEIALLQLVQINYGKTLFRWNLLTCIYNIIALSLSLPPCLSISPLSVSPSPLSLPLHLLPPLKI